MQVATLAQHEALEAQLARALARLEVLETQLPAWVHEDEAQRLTGCSQSTLARERKCPNTLLVFKTTGGLRYERRSLLAYNEARAVRRRAARA